jgi:hypothetical protein
MGKYSVYYETDDDNGSMIVEANSRFEAECIAKEELSYEVNHVEATEVKR